MKDWNRRLTEVIVWIRKETETKFNLSGELNNGGNRIFSWSKVSLYVAAVQMPTHSSRRPSGLTTWGPSVAPTCSSCLSATRLISPTNGLSQILTCDVERSSNIRSFGFRLRTRLRLTNSKPKSRPAVDRTLSDDALSMAGLAPGMVMQVTRPLSGGVSLSWGGSPAIRTDDVARL